MNTKRARTLLFWFFVGAGIGLVILILAGCEALDRAASDANDVAAVGRQVIDSPAGRLLPPDVRLYGSLAVSVVMAGAAGYKQWRLAQMSKTTKAIVRGIEAAERQPGDEATVGKVVNPVKVAIAAEMRDFGIYDAGNKIVDRLKIS